jgi:hypothetical protein
LIRLFSRLLPLLLVTALAGHAQISFTSVTHNFNKVLDGQSLTYGVELTNNSGSAFAFALTKAGSGEFTFVDNCGSSVAAGAKCEIIFTFAPTVAGAVSATWSLAAHGETFTPADGGTVSGTGVATPGFTITTDAHNFGTGPLHSSTPAYGVVLSNSTDDGINLTLQTNPRNAADFPLTANNCPAELGPSQSCELAWSFDPQVTGSITANYKLSGVDAVTGEAVLLSSPEKKRVTKVNLTGDGTRASGVLLTTAGHTFADQGMKTTSPTYGAELTNATASALSLTYAGSGSTSSFPSQGTSCGATLAANASCDMQWAFDPQTASLLHYDYAIAATSGGSPVTITSGGAPVTGIALTGLGLTGTLGLTQSTNNFGAWVEGHTSSTFLSVLSNTTPSEVSLTYGTTGTPADFPQTEDTCGAMLLAGASCNLQWDFTPQTTGKLSSSFRITAVLTASNFPVSVTSGKNTVNGVALSGFSEATAGVFLDTATNDFGEQGVGGVSDAFTANLYNTTSSAVDLTFAYSNQNAAKNFTLTSNNCGAALAANTTCGLTLEFSPVVAGAASVVYDVTATQGGSPITITSGGNPVNGVTLHGTGVE